MKAWKAARPIGEKIEKVPLRHQGDEAAMDGEMREIGEDQALVADLARQFAHLLMRAFQEIIENAEFVHDLERGRMDGVAAEIAQKIDVLLQHHDVYAGAGQEKPEHDAGGAAAGDRATRGDGLSHGYTLASAAALR
jgi:hypothetical protein